jgi:RNA polymerase sigma-70 factor (ECF subfamily)
VALDDAPREQTELLARCRSGDGGAQRAFYERYSPLVLRMARRLGTPPEELEDVVQEVFAVAFRKLPKFTGSEPSSWIYRICALEVQHRHRTRRVRQAISRIFDSGLAPANIESQERVTARHEAERRVGEILQRMNPKKREVFVLFEIEGLSGEAIAARIGCPVDTVWTRLFHARREFARIGRARDLFERSRSGG